MDPFKKEPLKEPYSLYSGPYINHLPPKSSRIRAMAVRPFRGHVAKAEATGSKTIIKEFTLNYGRVVIIIII